MIQSKILPVNKIKNKNFCLLLMSISCLLMDKNISASARGVRAGIGITGREARQAIKTVHKVMNATVEKAKEKVHELELAVESFEAELIVVEGILEKRKKEVADLAIHLAETTKQVDGDIRTLQQKDDEYAALLKKHTEAVSDITLYAADAERIKHSLDKIATATETQLEIIKEEKSNLKHTEIKEIKK